MGRKKKIHHIIMLGDSLSDRGTMNRRRLAGVIPMAAISGLASHSPLGRFTNGYVWGDHLANEIADESIIRKSEKKGKDSTDIADDIIAGRLEEPEIQHAITFKDDRHILYKGSDFVRSYCEGGLSAADYSNQIDSNIAVMGAREIVSTLKLKRNELLQADKDRGNTAEYKARSLIIEWSGANDLITVNDYPTILEVKKAVAARVENVKKLYQAGYRNFALVNLPDLSLTPRFQNKDPKDQKYIKNAAYCANEFNAMLETACFELKMDYPEMAITVIDANKTFKDAYEHPKKYKLNPELKKSPYIDSDEFEEKYNLTSPAPGYMFWDDVHPTAHVHAILAQTAYTQLTERFDFSPVKESFKQKFVDAYEEKFKQDKAGIFGFFRKSNFKNYAAASLTDIFRHALKEKGYRTLSVLRDLGWLDKNNQLVSKNPELKQAWDAVHQQPNVVPPQEPRP